MHSLPFGVLWTENRAQYLHLYQWMRHIPIDFGGDNCSRGKSLWEGRPKWVSIVLRPWEHAVSGSCWGIQATRREGTFGVSQKHQDSGRNLIDFGQEHPKHFHDFRSPSLQVGNGRSTWGETRWDRYVSWFWLCFGFLEGSEASETASHLTWISLCREGHGSSSPSQLWAATTNNWWVTRCWEDLVGEESAFKQIFIMGWANIPQK